MFQVISSSPTAGGQGRVSKEAKKKKTTDLPSTDQA